MKTIKITFSIRDWRRGMDLLMRLGFIDQELITEEWVIEIEEDWQEESLRDELRALDLEFEIEDVDGE